MDSKKALLLTCLLGVILSMIIYVYSPDKVATHFNGSGNPDGWSSRSHHLILWIALYLLVTGIFLIFPFLLKKTPMRFVNMPKKQYWFAPERKQMAITMVSDRMYEFGAALNLFFIVFGYIVFRANTLEKVQINNISVFILLGLFFIFLIRWLIKFYKQFEINDNDLRSGI